ISRGAPRIFSARGARIARSAIRDRGGRGGREAPDFAMAQSGLLLIRDWTTAAGGLSMRVKQILSDARLVIAEIEVSHNGALRSNPTLCAAVKGKDGVEQVIPLNTPDGRPIFMNWDNAVALPK